MIADSTKVILANDASEKNGEQEEKIMPWKKAIFDFNSPITKMIIDIENNTDTNGFVLYDVQLLNRNKPGLVYDNVGWAGRNS